MSINRIRTCLISLALPFALCGLAIAQPVFNLLANTPLFLVARQNTAMDVWALTGTLSIVLPCLLVLPLWFLSGWKPSLTRPYAWTVNTLLAALLFAQLLQPWSDAGPWLFVGTSLVLAAGFSYLLLFTRWTLLAVVMAVLALVFPIKFLLNLPVAGSLEGISGSTLDLVSQKTESPEIVFLILDELPIATLLDGDGNIDGSLFPGFRRLQQISNWYSNTTSVTDGTTDAVPAILTGRYPAESITEATIAEKPVNLFTLLRQSYEFNVAESITSLCPADKCLRSGPGTWARFRSLLLDLAAVYMHKVTPQAWIEHLPDVSGNWSGFFASRQVFFPEGWSDHVGGQTLVDRPAYIRQFIQSIQPGSAPTLNFLHVLFPHGPQAYLPDGSNYGLSALPGRVKDHWEDHEWALTTSKQRHYLQVQLADRLLSELLDHLEQLSMLENTMLVVVADHGISFIAGDAARDLTPVNAQSMLRVPMFIKAAGQMHGERLTRPAMTIDLLPTMLTRLGADPVLFDLDGASLDLQPNNKTEPRPRFANSHFQRELQQIEESRLDVDRIVAENRSQLKLDDPSTALWQLGPFDAFRGQSLAAICATQKPGMRVRFARWKALPETAAESQVRAYINGVVTGKMVPDVPTRFIISSNGVIAGSGTTWKFNDRWRFFALLPPDLVKPADWAPKIYLVIDDQCLTGR